MRGRIGGVDLGQRFALPLPLGRDEFETSFFLARVRLNEMGWGCRDACGKSTSLPPF
jgi:hypothetical protein